MYTSHIHTPTPREAKALVDLVDPLVTLVPVEPLDLQVEKDLEENLEIQEMMANPEILAGRVDPVLVVHRVFLV